MLFSLGTTRLCSLSQTQLIRMFCCTIPWKHLCGNGESHTFCLRPKNCLLHHFTVQGFAQGQRKIGAFVTETKWQAKVWNVRQFTPMRWTGFSLVYLESLAPQARCLLQVPIRPVRIKKDFTSSNERKRRQRKRWTESIIWASESAEALHAPSNMTGRQLKASKNFLRSCG